MVISSLRNLRETAEETTTFPEEQDGEKLNVSVVDTPVGLSIQEDRKLVHDQVNNPDFYEEFEAGESITIAAANGGAVVVEVNGEELAGLISIYMRYEYTCCPDKAYLWR